MTQNHDAEWDPTIGHLAGEIEPTFAGDEVAPDGKPWGRRGLSPRQVTALQTLAAGRGPAAAAREAKVNRGTVYRWMNYDSLFREALANCRDAGVHAAQLQLHTLALHAVAALRQGLIDGDGWLGLRLLQSLRVTQDANLPAPTQRIIDAAHGPRGDRRPRDLPRESASMPASTPPAPQDPPIGEQHPAASTEPLSSDGSSPPSAGPVTSSPDASGAPGETAAPAGGTDGAESSASTPQTSPPDAVDDLSAMSRRETELRRGVPGLVEELLSKVPDFHA